MSNFYSYYAGTGGRQQLRQLLEHELPCQVIDVAWLKPDAAAVFDSTANLAPVRAAVCALARRDYSACFTGGDEMAVRAAFAAAEAEHFFAQARLPIDKMARDFVSQLGATIAQAVPADEAGAGTRAAPVYVAVAVDEDDIQALLAALTQRLLDTASPDALITSQRAREAAERLQAHWSDPSRRGYHVTLWHSARDSPRHLEVLKRLEHTSVRLEPRFFGMDGDVAAVLVGLAPPDAVQEPTSGCEGTADAGCHTAVPPCLNSHPHVTVWIRKKGLAYRSNDLLARLVSPEGEPQSEALVALKVQQQQQQEASGESARADEGGSAQRESEDKSYQDDLGLMLQVQATKGAEQVLAHLPRLRGSVKFHYR